MKQVKNIILDPGHGGIDKNGNYTTAPHKMYKFNDGYVIYEGEVNRIQAKAIEKSFLAFPDWDINIKYTVKPDDSRDISLEERSDFVNSFNPEETICLSIHNNAGGGDGFEAYTYFGQTDSDVYADEIYKSIKTLYDKYGLPIRTDKLSDSDYDKEIELHMTRETKCPCVLLEYLFFDNRVNAKLLMSNNFIKDIAFSTVVGVQNGIFKLKNNK